MSPTNDASNTPHAVQRGLFDHAPDRLPAPSERRTEHARQQGKPTERVIVAPELLEEVGLPGRLDLVWRRSPVFGDCYLVNHEAHVLSLPRKDCRGNKRKGMLRKASVNSSGYPGLSLTKDRIPRYFHLHVLVALSFLGEPGPRGRGQGCFEVHHLDEDPLNPRADNLVWLSTSDHSRLAHSILTEEAVIEMRVRAASGETHQALADEFGVARATATHAITGRSWADVKFPA